jgi:hypothetical protein
MTIRKTLTGHLIAIAALPALGAEPTAESLRQVFWACELQASSGLLGSADAAQCSTAYEQLLRREFQGDFRKFLAWWQAQRPAVRASAHAGAAR